MKRLLLIYLLTSCGVLCATNLLAQTWKDMDSGTNIIHELVEIGGELYAVGSSNTANNPGIVLKYENSAWVGVGNGFNDFTTVHAIAEYNGDIYIGGTFSMDNGTDASFDYAAKWDDANARWIPVSNGSVSDEGIFELYVYDGLLFAGGNFDDLGQAGNDNLAAYNGTSWSFIGNSTGISSAILASTATHQVTSMVEYEGELIVAGKFDMIDGTLVHNIASWNGTTWTYLKGDATFEGGGVGGDEAFNYVPYVKDLAVFNDILYIAGNIDNLYNIDYQEANATAVSRNIVLWDGVDFYNPNKQPFANTVLQGVTVHDGKIYFGSGNDGDLHSWNGDNNFNWQEETSLGSINSLFSDGSTIYRGTDRVYKLADPISSFYYTNATPCIGENITFVSNSTGSTAITGWNWTFEGGTPSTSTDESPSVSYSSPGEFDVTLEVTSSTGTDITKKVDYVAVDETITIDTHPDNITECPDIVYFDVSATTVSGIKTYQWQVDDGTGYVDLLAISSPSTERVLGPTTASLGIFANTGRSGYKYRCVIASCSNESISNEATLTVNDGPVIVTHPTPAEVCISGDASYTVEITGGTGITYQWQYYLGSSMYADLSDNATYSGTNTATLSLNGIDENLAELIYTSSPIYNSGNFRCVIGSSNGCTVNSSLPELKVYKALPAVTVDITTQPLDVTGVCDNAGDGETAKFKVIYSTPPSIVAYSVDKQWQIDDGNGFVNIENAEGSYSGATANELTVHGATHSSFDYKYRCEITVACGNPIYTNEVVFEVDDKPVITLQPVSQQIQVCEGAIVEFTVAATGVNLTYQWQLSGSNITDNAIYTGANSPTLVVDTETLGGSPSANVSYRCVISTNGEDCSTNSSNGRITIFDTPSFSAAPADRIECEGGNSVTFSRGAFNFSPAVHSYQWQEAMAGSDIFVDIADGDKFSGTNGTILNVLAPAFIMNGNRYRNSVVGCNSPVYSEPGTLTVNQLPLMTTSPQSQTVCQGEEVTFTAQSAIGTDIKYQWMVDEGSGTYSNVTGSAAAGSDGFSTYTISSSFVTGDLNGNKYICVARGASPCDQNMLIESFEATLTVNEVTILTHPEQVTICRGEDASFAITAQGEGLTYQWQVGGTDITDGDVYAGATTATLSITGATQGLHGSSYHCVVSGNCDAVTSLAKPLLVDGVDKPVLFADFNNAESPTISVSNVSGDTYQWFLDGTSLESGNSSMTIDQAGSYTVIVSVNGCPSEESDPQVIVVTGLNPEASNLVSMHPNPIKDVMTITLVHYEKDAHINVLSMDGKIKKSNPVTSNINNIDMSELSTGVYIIQIQNGSNSSTRRVIKE